MWKGLTLLAANEFGTSFKRNMTALAYYSAAGLICFTAVIFGLIALHEWLEFYMSGIEASLAIALGLLVIAAITALTGRHLKNRRPQQNILANAAFVAAPLAARMVGKRINAGTLAIAGVIALGALLGRQITKD